MRFAKSFLISLNLHIWGIGLLSVIFVLARPAQPPEHLEVKFLKLPRPAAVVEGETRVPPELVGLTQEEDRSRLRSRQPQKGPQKARRLREREREINEGQPIVEYRVRIAKEYPDTKVTRRGARRAPESDPEYARAHAVRPYMVAEAVRTTGKRPRPEGEEVSLKGDTRPILEIIQARIDAVTPLAHASAPGCLQETGVVRLAFVIDTLGYPCGYRIVKSSGSRCLDDEVDNVLHLAEPYPYLAGWIPVTVRFTL